MPQLIGCQIGQWYTATWNATALYHYDNFYGSRDGLSSSVYKLVKIN